MKFSMSGQEKGDLLIQVTAYTAHSFVAVNYPVLHVGRQEVNYYNLMYL
jgi:hypothetical protein